MGSFDSVPPSRDRPRRPSAATNLKPSRAAGTRTLGLVAVATASFIYATEAILIRHLDLPEISIAGIRLGFATAGGLAIAAVRHQASPPLAALQMRRLMVLGVLVALNGACFVLAVKRTDVGVALIIAFTWPLWTALFYRAIRVHTTRPSTTLAFGASLGGVALLALRDGIPNKADALGMAAATIVAITMACMVIIERSIDRSMPSVALFVWKSGIAAVLLFPLAIASLPGDGLDLGSVGILAILGVLISGFGGTLFLTGNRILPAAETAALSYLEPVGATALAAILLTEVPGPRAILGITIMVVASMSVLVKGQREFLILPEPTRLR